MINGYKNLLIEKIRDFNKTASDRYKINTPSYSQVIEPLYKNSINRWKNYEQFDLIYPKLEKWINRFDY